MFETIAPLYDNGPVALDRQMSMLRFVQLYEPIQVDVSPSYFEHEDFSLAPLAIDTATAYYVNSS